MAKIIDGKALRDQVLRELKDKVAKLSKKPKLAIVLVGDSEASLRYIKQKQKAAEEIGAESVLVQLPETISQTELDSEVGKLNLDQSITGIIVQLPLPDSVDTGSALQKIDPKKDVDGLVAGSEFKPATPLGVMEILRSYAVEIREKTVTVIGQGKLVGEPLSKMLEEGGAKVIRIDINTPPPIDELVKQGDIIVAAVGKIGLVTADMVKNGAVVIDVGTNVTAEGKLVGDVDFNNVSQKASLITPVPGGVGPMTVASLMKNLVLAASIDKGNPKSYK